MGRLEGVGLGFHSGQGEDQDEAAEEVGAAAAAAPPPPKVAADDDGVVAVDDGFALLAGAALRGVSAARELRRRSTNGRRRSPNAGLWRLAGGAWEAGGIASFTKAKANRESDFLFSPFFLSFFVFLFSLGRQTSFWGTHRQLQLSLLLVPLKDGIRWPQALLHPVELLVVAKWWQRLNPAREKRKPLGNHRAESDDAEPSHQKRRRRRRKQTRAARRTWNPSTMLLLR